jgi:hypothetical protein
MPFRGEKTLHWGAKDTFCIVFTSLEPKCYSVAARQAVSAAFADATTGAKRFRYYFSVLQDLVCLLSVHP